MKKITTKLKYNQLGFYVKYTGELFLDPAGTMPVTPLEDTSGYLFIPENQITRK